MNHGAPRVAFFADSFHEVNGVALTCRQLDAFARRNALPLLSVHAAPQADFVSQGSVSTLSLDRGPTAVPIEHDLSFDPLFMRHRHWVESLARAFRPDIVHITGPSDVGILGMWLAHRLRLPVAASWHTNIHEFGARRLDQLISFMPPAFRDSVASITERGILSGCARFYRSADVLLAPNEELVEMLKRRTGRPAFLMQRGADTEQFHPRLRSRAGSTFILGFVGRLTPEKNVRLLADIERALLSAGETDFKFVVIGQGGDLDWLKSNLRQAEFPGVLKGAALAEAYANMDLFVFPSHTDTFGNVILEASASGVPCIVTASGGPKYLVEDGVTGYIAADDRQFMRRAVSVVKERTLQARMRTAARDFALTMSWDRVFERVYEAYSVALNLATAARSRY